MNRRVPPHVLAVLMLGIVSQIGQVLLLRELLMVFHGNEFSIGLILAAWMAWVGVGSRLGARLAEALNRRACGQPAIEARLLLLPPALNAAGILVALPATILFIRGLRGMFDVPPGAYLSVTEMAISCVLLLAPVCLLLGAQFVLLARVWRQSDRAEDTSGASKTYVGEAAGNMLGGILFTLLIVRHLGSLQSALLAGALMLAANLVTAGIGVERKGRSFRGWPFAALALLLLALLGLAPMARLDEWAYRLQWRQLAPQHRLIEVRQSKHGAIAVLQREDQYSFFQSGHLVFSVAGPEARDLGLEEQEAAILAHLAMAQHPLPARVLLIGGGLRGTLREVARHPVERIDYVELDEVLTRAAKPYVSPSTREALSDPRVRLLHTDGRLYVRSAHETYDLILVDLPDPATAVLNRYYTLEFFQEAEALLNPGGVLVIGVTSTPDLRASAVANRNAMLYHTLRAVFRRVFVAGEHALVYFASNTPEQISVDAATLEERYLARGIQSDGFDPRHYSVLLYEPQLRRANWVVRAHGRQRDAHLTGPGPLPLAVGTLDEQEQLDRQLPPVVERYFINTDLKPIGYSYTLMLWDDRARRGDWEAFRWLLRLEPGWFLPWLSLPLLTVPILRVAGRHTAKRQDIPFAVLCAVFTTGFSIMALQIALLFSFQTVYGFIYEMVGVIVAMFMGGLALGTLACHRYVPAKADLRLLAALQLLNALLGVLVALALPSAAGLSSPTMVFLLFSSLTVASGLVNGIGFPVSAACYLGVTRRAERTTGTVYAVELFGACLGATVTSVAVAPILGVVASCLLAAAANGAAFLALLMTGRFHANQD